MKGFVEFIRKQGVVGFAVGLMLGGAVQKLVSSFVENIVNPLLGLLLGSEQSLKSATFAIGSAQIGWGAFASTVIDFVVIAAVIYFGIKGLRLERLDKPKE